ncbi:hypothetical protein [Thermococcus sp. ES12]|uniref:hypothetical protein n=1 Tax=Thermococcus sp. ES12 TaxID=1638246 RepID=UPI001430CC06|nr:hypothetical protein [Thermococcus sp. ES12]NJE76777.1 hypothetical protein [Thermococcus sp. ES12]
MRDWKVILLLGCFALQLVINLVFYGFPAILFSAIVPESLYPKIAWSLPFLIFAYFLLAIASLYYLGISPRLERGRLFGSAYFVIGSLGSAWVISTISSVETPLLPIVFGVWLISSLVGIAALWLMEEKLPALPAAVMVALFGISALISAATAQWVVADYYVHAGSGIPENATAVVGHPVEVPPPNFTNSS